MDYTEQAAAQIATEFQLENIPTTQWPRQLQTLWLDRAEVLRLSAENETLTRERDQARAALREVLLQFGVRSGECRTCDVVMKRSDNRHAEWCPIPKWVALAAETEEACKQ